jgi:hypothetical protein
VRRPRGRIQALRLAGDDGLELKGSIFGWEAGLEIRLDQTVSSLSKLDAEIVWEGQRIRVTSEVVIERSQVGNGVSRVVFGQVHAEVLGDFEEAPRVKAAAARVRDVVSGVVSSRAGPIAGAVAGKVAEEAVKKGAEKIGDAIGEEGITVSVGPWSGRNRTSRKVLKVSSGEVEYEDRRGVLRKASVASFLKWAKKVGAKGSS